MEGEHEHPIRHFQGLSRFHTAEHCAGLLIRAGGQVCWDERKKQPPKVIPVCVASVALALPQSTRFELGYVGPLLAFVAKSISSHALHVLLQAGTHTLYHASDHSEFPFTSSRVGVEWPRTLEKNSLAQARACGGKQQHHHHHHREKSVWSHA